MTADLYRVINELHTQQNITIIMVSHDVRGAVEQADHVLHLGNRQLFYGATEDYRNSELGRRFLGGASC